MRIVVEGLGATLGPRDGAGRVVAGISAALARRPEVSTQVLVGPSMSGWASTTPEQLRIDVLPVCGRVRRLLAQHVLVPALARRASADAVLLLGNYLPVFPGPPTVTYLTNLLLATDSHEYGKARALYRRWARGRVAQSATCVAAISETLADALLDADRSFANKITVIHPGIDEDFFHGGDDRPVGAPPAYFLGVGTLWRYRDYPLALKAIAASGLPHSLVLIGATPAQERAHLEWEAERLGLRGRLLLQGSVTNAELLSWYVAADALLGTSTTEAFALPPGEAMAIGTPVVAVRRTSYPEVVADGGLLVEPEVEPLAAALRKIIEPDERRAAVKRGKRRAAELTWERCVSELLFACREAAGITAPSR